MMGTGEIIYEKVYASPRPPPKISFQDNWMKELGSEVAGGHDQQTQPKPKHPIVRTVRLVLAEQPSRSSGQEIDKRVLLERESINVRTGRPVDSCVPVSVERLDQDKDADENVDADQVTTVRPVESEQSIGLFTQREEIDIDFRVSWIATCSCETSRKFSCSRTREEDRESSSSRKALQADLQQNNAYNLFSDESKSDDS